MKKIILAGLLPLCFINKLNASTILQEPTKLHPFYAGGMIGYGSTTWNGLVPTKENLDSTLSVFIPISVSEGGAAYGAFTGYEFNPYFALEATYTRYHNAKITFDNESVFAYDHNDQNNFNTHTESYNISAKIMMFIPNTHIRAFSSFGIANTHREDILLNDWNLGPTFGLGLNFEVNPHLMMELNGNYTAGYGDSRLNPAESYFPFLYSVGLRMAYRF